MAAPAAAGDNWIRYWVLRLELRALLVELRHRHVRPEDGDVHGDDPREQEREEDHPDDVSADATMSVPTP